MRSPNIRPDANPSPDLSPNASPDPNPHRNPVPDPSPNPNPKPKPITEHKATQQLQQTTLPRLNIACLPSRYLPDTDLIPPLCLVSPLYHPRTAPTLALYSCYTDPIRGRHSRTAPTPALYSCYTVPIRGRPDAVSDPA